MASPSELLAIAIQHHQAGRLGSAEPIYRQILQTNPGDADANHLLGVLALQVGDFNNAVPYFERAIQANGHAAAFHNNLGEAYRALRRLPEAASCYRRALELDPRFAGALCNLGNVLNEEGAVDDAIGCYRRALVLQPTLAEAHNNLGKMLDAQEKLDDAVACFQKALTLLPNFVEALCNLGDTLRGQGKLDDAVACYRRALDGNPRSAEAHNGLGNARHLQGQTDEAIACFQQALSLKPTLAEAHNNLGNVLVHQKRFDEAIVHLRLAVEQRPNFAEAHNNLGIALKEIDKIDDAMDCYRRAIELKSNFPEAHNNLAVALKDLGMLDAAETHFNEAVRLRPHYVQGRWNRSLLRLLRGQFAEGWPEFEWGWTHAHKSFNRFFPQPRWDGSTLLGKTILLYAEQGLGDTLMFVRYARLVKERGGRVLLDCQPELRRLLATVEGVEMVVGGEGRTRFDLCIPLTSLPGIFRTDLTSIPATPYLAGAVADVEQWRRELHHLPGLKVGIAWQGSTIHKNDRRRSVPLSAFAPLAAVPGVTLVSLQKGVGREQIASLGGQFPIIDFAERLHDFADTAALVTTLDLVISVDSAVVHLAGGLGKRVWTLTPHAPDWRWLVGRDDSPWYPTMRLFRQETAGDWPGVFNQIARELKQFVIANQREAEPKA